MKESTDSPFDRRFEIRKDRIPRPLADSMVWVNDTMEMAFASAQQLFGEEFTADHVIAIYDRFLERADAAVAEDGAL